MTIVLLSSVFYKDDVTRSRTNSSSLISRFPLMMFPTGYKRKPGNDIYRPRGFHSPVFKSQKFVSFVCTYLLPPTVLCLPFYAAA